MTSASSPSQQVSPSFRARALACACAAATFAAASPAGAQTATDKAEAESLFDEANGLLRTGDAAAACPKLERSLRLDRGIGTLLFLAECYERVGRVASAWATFREAAAEARAAGQTERERIATARAKKLDANVPRLRVDVPAGVLPPDATIIRDERALDPAAFGTAIAVDPGVHVVLVTAPGHEPLRLTRSLDVGEEATVRVIALARTAPAPSVADPAPPPAPAPRPARDGRSVRLPTYVVGGAGVALGAVGAFFGKRAFDKWDDARGRCDAQIRCAPEGLARIDEARSAANVANVFVAASVLTLSASGLLLWRDLRAEIALQDRGMSVRGRF